MKKTLFVLILLPFFSFISFSQNAPEEFNSIQQFIESTVQIPFMARVANLQEVVKVIVVMGNDSLPAKYNIVQNVTPECDSEAVRVIKLINIRMLRQTLNGKKKLLIEVPFYNTEKVIYEDGFVLNYYDKNQTPTNNEPDIKFVSRYLVDSTTGIIKSNIEYLELNKKKVSRVGLALLRTDTLEYHIPTFLENQSDSLKKTVYLVNPNSKYPNYFEVRFKNGRIATKKINNKIFTYYPNGRIENTNEIEETTSEITYTDIHWFANGQLAYIKKTVNAKLVVTEKYVSVWDTLGRQIVSGGNGMNEYYEGHLGDFTVHKGLMKDGLKEGNWIGKNAIGGLKYEEFYEKGICKNGKSYEGNEVSTYATPNEPAEFNNGMPGFGKFLQGTLKYPSAALRANVSGKVYVQFVVCTDGTLCDYKVLQSVGFGCDEESLRVLALSSGKWKPGKQRGRAVRTRFTMPISYQLSR